MRGGRPGLPIVPLPPIGRPDVKTQPRCNLWFYDYMFAAQNWTITRRALLTIVTTVFIADFAAYNRSGGRAEDGTNPTRARAAVPVSEQVIQMTNLTSTGTAILFKHFG